MPMMSENAFWKLIDSKVVRKQGNMDVAPLRKVLAKMSPKDIQGFDERLTKCYYESYTWDLWGAAYLIHDGAPDDTFDYFRSWLIGQGRKVFMAAMKNPDSLVDVANPGALDDELYNIGQSTYESVTGKEIPDSRLRRPKLKKHLDFNDPDVMAQAYPKLFQKFGDMYEPTPRDALLDRCREYAGGRGLWKRENLKGFFNRFRPDGKGLAEIYSGIEHGKDITKRLIAVMKVDGSTKGSELSAKNLIEVDPRGAQALVKRFCKNMQSLAREFDAEEMVEQFTVKKFVIQAGARRRFTSNDRTEEAIELVCDVAFNVIYDCWATASILDDAIYSLVGFNPLAFYIQWPVCANKVRTADPLKPWFELWRRGVKWRFKSDGEVEIFMP